MKTVPLAVIVAAALVAGHLHLAAAESAKLRYLASIYFDDKGGGLSQPEGVACDGKGQLIVGDTGNGRLLRFTYIDRTVAGGSEIKIPELSAPSKIQLTSKGDLYALDGTLRRIVHLGAGGELKAVVSYQGAPPPSTIVPRSFAIDAADNVYVLDVFSARVLMIDAEGRFVRVLPLPAEIGFASDLVVDPLGNAVLLDSIGRRLYTAGKDAGVFAPLGGSLTASLLTLPTSIAASRGTIFVAEGIGSSIVTFGRDGAFLARLLTAGRTEGSLAHPAQICINDKDEVFIADRDNSRIQVFASSR